MTIVINGDSREEFSPPLNVTGLIEQLGLAGQPVLVELDEVALRPREYDATSVTDGARVEIIRVAAGG